MVRVLESGKKKALQQCSLKVECPVNLFRYTFYGLINPNSRAWLANSSCGIKTEKFLLLLLNEPLPLLRLRCDFRTNFKLHLLKLYAIIRVVDLFYGRWSRVQRSLTLKSAQNIMAIIADLWQQQFLSFTTRGMYYAPIFNKSQTLKWELNFLGFFCFMIVLLVCFRRYLELKVQLSNWDSSNSWSWNSYHAIVIASFSKPSLIRSKTKVWDLLGLSQWICWK